MKILVIEDNHLFQDELVSRLEAHGHLVTRASYRNEGCIFLREQKFNLIITDNNMPILSDEHPEDNIGIEVIREARRVGENKQTPIWLMSYELTAEVARNAFKYGHIEGIGQGGSLRTVSKDDLFGELSKIGILGDAA